MKRANFRTGEAINSPSVFPNVAEETTTGYSGDGDTPLRPPNDPLPSVFPREIAPAAMEYLADVIRSGFTSDAVSQFEAQFAEACQVKYAVAMANCTAACHSAVAVCDLEPGDEVIVSAITDYGSVMGILSEGLVPVFADVDPETGNTTASEIEKVITPRTRAIILVYFYGLMIDLDPILELAARHNLVLIEDCCQTPLASYKGRMAGASGTMGCFSLDSEKHLSTDGGGVVITNSGVLAERLRRFAWSRGSISYPGFGRKHVELGYNYRYSSIQAAIGLAQLPALPRLNATRRESARRLTGLLEGVEGLSVHRPPEGIDHVYWLYNIQLDPNAFRATVDDIAAAMVREGMKDCGTARYYLIPEALTFLPTATRPSLREAASRSHQQDQVCPNAKWHLNRTIRWAWTAKYTDRDIDDMARIVIKVLKLLKR